MAWCDDPSNPKYKYKQINLTKEITLRGIDPSRLI